MASYGHIELRIMSLLEMNRISKCLSTLKRFFCSNGLPRNGFDLGLRSRTVSATFMIFRPAGELRPPCLKSRLFCLKLGPTCRKTRRTCHNLRPHFLISRIILRHNLDFLQGGLDFWQGGLDFRQIILNIQPLGLDFQKVGNFFRICDDMKCQKLGSFSFDISTPHCDDPTKVK